VEAVLLHYSLLEAHVHLEQSCLLLRLLKEVAREMRNRLVLALQLVAERLCLLFELPCGVVVFLKLGFQVQLFVFHF